MPATVGLPLPLSVSQKSLALKISDNSAGHTELVTIPNRWESWVQQSQLAYW